MEPSVEEPRADGKRPSDIAVALLFSSGMVALGYLAIAPLVAVVFSVGFFGGFFLWLARPMHASFPSIKGPYLLALAAYVIHRVEEEISGFVAAIEDLTGGSAAGVVSPVSIVLVLFSVAWMASPVLIRRGHPLGYYGAWTLFTSFGVLELWHFLFPLLTSEPYGYFPGMFTVLMLAPIAWWGMWRLWRGDRNDRSPP